MFEITANEIKTRGISAIDEIWGDEDDAVITVNGKKKYVIFPIDKYNKIRELELELAVIESRKDIADGRYHTGIQEHIKSVFDV